MPDNTNNIFSYSDSEFLCVFNHICVDTSINVPITDITTKLLTSEYDSLDLIILFGWLSEMFNMNFNSADLEAQLLKDITLKELKNLIAKNATQNFNFIDLKKYSVCQ